MLLSSYKKKLIGLFTLIALVPIILFSFSVYNRINTYIIDENLKAKTSFITNEAEKINVWFMSNAEKVSDIASCYPFIKSLMNEVDGDRKVNEYLASQLKSSKEVINLRLVLTGSKEYSSNGDYSIQNPRSKSDYLDALHNKELTWTMQEQSNDTPIITASAPLYNTSGQIEGVVLVDFSVNKILNKIREINKEYNYTKYVVTSQGKVLNVYGEEKLRTEENYKDFENKISTLVSKSISTYTGRGRVPLDKNYMVFYSTIPSIGWKILTLVPRQAIFDSLSVLIKDIAFITSITLISLVVFATLFSRMFSNPLVKLKNGAIEIQNGNYDYKFDIKKEDEFGQVAMAFNAMAAKLKESYEELNDNNIMLMETNEQLQEINMELEASYAQLKAAIDQLDESEQRFRTLLGNIDELVWIMDRNLNITFTNDQVESILMISKERFLGRNLNELINYVVGDGEAFLNDFIETDLKNRVICISHSKKDGIIAEVSTKRVYENNKLVAIHGIIRDITERKMMEESIIKRNEELVVINRVSRGLTTAMNIDTLMQRAVEGIIRLMNISLCTIRLLEDDKLVLKAFAGELSDLVVKKPIPVDEDEVGQAVKTGKIQILEINKNYNKSKFSANIVDSKKVSFLSVLPIKARGKVRGIMIVGSKSKPDKGEFNVLASISNQVALITENISLYQGLKDNYLKTIETLAAAIEAKDEYTEGHSNRVSKYSLEIAKYMGMPKKFCEEIEVAGILHDIGKIGIKDGVLSKPGRLTEEEYEMIRRHPMIGSKILESVGFSETIMNAIKFHHKRYDLKGYPQEVYIKELPLEAAIIGVADAFDAMTTSRSYRNAITVEAAINELIKSKGTQFNPYIVDIMVDIYRRNRDVIESIMQTDITFEGTSLA